MYGKTAGTDKGWGWKEKKIEEQTEERIEEQTEIMEELPVNKEKKEDYEAHSEGTLLCDEI